MVRILKPGEPFTPKPSPKEMKEMERDPNHVALCAWIDAQLHKAAWETERSHRDQLAARIVNGERWMAEHPDDPRRAEALGLLVQLRSRHRYAIGNMQALANVGWYWCCLTWEAGQRADPGWDRELNDKASDAPSARAIWDRLWEIEPPESAAVEERKGWPDRQLQTVEVWNLPDMQELARRLAI